MARGRAEARRLISAINGGMAGMAARHLVVAAEESVKVWRVSHYDLGCLATPLLAPLPASCERALSERNPMSGCACPCTIKLTGAWHPEPISSSAAAPTA